MPRRHPYHAASLLLACAIGTCAQAAEFGDARVNSFIGQPLSADIELTSLADPASAVAVRLASIDVYRGANLDMPAVLAGVHLNVMRRDGKQFLHVTSTKPVESDHVHLYLELVDGNHRDVRLATLWFVPDPTPPAPPEHVAIPAPAPVAGGASEAAPVRPLPHAASSVAAPKAQKSAAPAAREKPADRQKAAGAEEPAVQGKPAVPEAPSVHEKAAATAAPALALASARQARPARWKLAKAPVEAACTKQPSEAESACSALDTRNAELRAQIGKLEARVNSLLAQESGQAPPVPGVSAPLAAARTPSAVAPGRLPQPRTQLAPAAPSKPVKEAEAGMPWGWIAGAGVAVFAIVGALQFWRHRRKRGPKPATVHAALPNEEEEQVEPAPG